MALTKTIFLKLHRIAFKALTFCWLTCSPLLFSISIIATSALGSFVTRAYDITAISITKMIICIPLIEIPEILYVFYIEGIAVSKLSQPLFHLFD